MGGKWRQKKIVVEECVVLDVDFLLRHRAISSAYVDGTLTLPTKAGDLVVAFACDHGRSLCLRYQFGLQNYSYVIPLTTTETRPFGGVQYWFLCPMTRASFKTQERVARRRRAGKLYLPPGSHMFACRSCYYLT